MPSRMDQRDWMYLKVFVGLSLAGTGGVYLLGAPQSGAWKWGAAIAVLGTLVFAAGPTTRKWIGQVAEGWTESTTPT